MELTTTSKIKNLKQAAIGYMIAGLGMLSMGIPYWFLGKNLEDEFATHWVSIFQIIDNFKDSLIGNFGYLVASAGMLLGAYSLMQIGEPIEWKRRKLFYIPIIGSFCHIISIKILVPFAPLGSFLYAIGFIIIGIRSIKANIWKGWKQYTPLFIGLFPFIMMYPLLIVTGNPPHHIIPLWGFAFFLFGFAAFLNSKEI